LVLFESPRRLAELLADAREALGDRPAAVVRELTKVHQEVVRGRLSELAEGLPGEVLGEVVVVIDGAPSGEQPDLGALAIRVQELTQKGVSRKQAAALVAQEAGVSKNALYRASLQSK
jgi:16S rRNA (cytidine1402-2'-O)-methyltransferase